MITSAPRKSSGQTDRREEAVGARVKTLPVIASKENLMMHIRGRNDAGPHGEGARLLLSHPDELDAQSDDRYSSQGSRFAEFSPGTRS